MSNNIEFRKKPVVIEAMQWDGTESGIQHIKARFPALDTVGKTGHLKRDEVTHWRIATLEGSLTVSNGDWIIRGVKGELYPCKPDIFEATYERAALAAQPVAQAPEGWREAMQAGADALIEIIDAGQKAKETLDAAIPNGEPVHPVSARLTWPLSTAMMAKEKLLSALLAAAPSPEASKPVQAEAPSEQALNTLWKMFHGGEEIEADDGLGMWVQIDQWHEALEALESITGDEDDALATPPAPCGAVEMERMEGWLKARGTTPINQPTWLEIWCAALASKPGELRQLLSDARHRIANLVGPAGAKGLDRAVLDRIDAALATQPQEVQKPVAYLSWGGFNLSGDHKSIDEAKRLLHEAGTVPELRAMLAEARVAQPEQVAQDSGPLTDRELAAIGRVINVAPLMLPKWSAVRIELEKDAGTVYWLDVKSGAWRHVDGGGEPFSEQISVAVGRAARASVEGSGT